MAIFTQQQCKVGADHQQSPKIFLWHGTQLRTDSTADWCHHKGLTIGIGPWEDQWDNTIGNGRTMAKAHPWWRGHAEQQGHTNHLEKQGRQTSLATRISHIDWSTNWLHCHCVRPLCRHQSTTREEEVGRPPFDTRRGAQLESSHHSFFKHLWGRPLLATRSIT